MKGLTLIEVLVSLVLAGITAAATATSFAASLHARAAAVSREERALAAEAAMEGRLAEVPEGLTEGTSVVRRGAFEVTTRIGAGPLPFLPLLEVEARRDGEPPTRLRTLVRRRWYVPDP